MNNIDLMVAQYRVMLLKVYIEYGYYNHEEFEAKVSEFRNKLENKQ